MAAVLRADEQKVWSETVVDRLAVLRQEPYGPWAAQDSRGKANQLAAALKPYGVETIQVYGKTDDGRPANRRGVVRADVVAAADRFRADGRWVGRGISTGRRLRSGRCVPVSLPTRVLPTRVPAIGAT